MLNKRFLNVTLFIPLFLMFLSACSPQMTSLTESPSEQPLPTIDFSAYPTPTLPAVTPEGAVVELGFNVKGWV